MLLSQINEKVEKVFADYGLDRSLGAVKPSDRPDLSDFQCNGVMRAAKIMCRKPREIAEEIADHLRKIDVFASVSVDGPGFINLTLTDNYIYQVLKGYQPDNIKDTERQKIIVDYGGPNVAKPLHVGHLRSAIIGEAIKRIARSLGHDVVGDIHIGDWGTPMGMLMAYLADAQPDWPYFSSNFQVINEQVKLPISAQDLNDLYPKAAKRFKEEPDFADRAREATAKLQAGHAGYRALWNQFVSLSIETIKQDFKVLDVDFDLWLGESDADPFVKNIVEDFINRGIARESEGAIIVDVAKEDDKYEIPPLILRKKDGAATYAATDLATIFMRAREKPDRILYVVDQRQHLHFLQVFRAAERAGLIPENVLEHIGFGTMNGKDGKPFKTREGGVMRLGDLIQNSRDLALKEAGFTNETMSDSVQGMTDKIAIAAIKFGDLSNPRTSDYTFDPDQFIRFEGKTGPYIQYASVRVRSIMEKADVYEVSSNIDVFYDRSERALALAILAYPEALYSAFNKRMPSDVCDYVYMLAREFSSFYKQCPVLGETDMNKRALRLLLSEKTLTTINNAFGCLAIPLPERMLRSTSPMP